MLDGVPRRGDIIDIYLFLVGIVTTVCYVDMPVNSDRMF